MNSFNYNSEILFTIIYLISFRLSLRYIKTWCQQTITIKAQGLCSKGKAVTMIRMIWMQWLLNLLTTLIISMLINYKEHKLALSDNLKLLLWEFQGVTVLAKKKWSITCSTRLKLKTKKGNIGHGKLYKQVNP